MTHHVLPCVLHEAELAFLTRHVAETWSSLLCEAHSPVFSAKETLVVYASGNNLPSVLLEGEQAFASMACQGQQQQPV